LELHYRNPPTHPTAPFLAPPSLQSIGPYGKAPVLVTGLKDGSRIIPESSAIATYLIRTFDTDDKFGLRSGDWVRDDMLLSVNQTNLGRLTMMMMMLDFNALAVGKGEFGKSFNGSAMRKALADLEKALKGGPPGGYFMGKEPGRADIMLEWPLASISQRKWVDIENEFPALDAWLARCYKRDAWKRSLQKGNGYDLTIFPQLPHLNF
jgi:glutathione S-transferase